MAYNGTLLAPASIYVEAYDTAGQSVTVDVTDYQYLTEVIDTHNAWNGTIFTAPIAGRYLISALARDAGGGSPAIWKNGTRYENGPVAYSATYPGQVQDVIQLAISDTIKFRSYLGGGARTTNAYENRMTIIFLGT